MPVCFCVHVAQMFVETFPCTCVLPKVRVMATSFTRRSDVRKTLSLHQDDRQEALAMDGAPYLEKINKTGTIVIEALSRKCAGV